MYYILKLVFRVFVTRYTNRAGSGQNLVGFEWLKSVTVTGPWPKNASPNLWLDPTPQDRNIYMIKIFFSGFGDKTIPMPLMDPSLEAYSVQIQDDYDKNTTTKGLEDSQKLMQNLGLNQV